MFIEIPGTTLVRDTNSMGLVNKDKNGLESYMKQRNNLLAQKQEINTVKSEIQGIKNDMAEIKQLMMQLLNKGSNG